MSTELKLQPRGSMEQFITVGKDELIICKLLSPEPFTVNIHGDERKCLRLAVYLLTPLSSYGGGLPSAAILPSLMDASPSVMLIGANKALTDAFFGSKDKPIVYKPETFYLIVNRGQKNLGSKKFNKWEVHEIVETKTE